MDVLVRMSRKAQNELMSAVPESEREFTDRFLGGQHEVHAFVLHSGNGNRLLFVPAESPTPKELGADAEADRMV